MQLLLFDEDPASLGDLVIERMVRPENLLKAYQRVKSNGGAPGVDGMTVNQLGECLWRELSRIREELLAGSYRPKPVRKVDIPKPGGGFRSLGIPTVLDRWIQQALTQVLTPLFDPGFSEWSFGFRPGRGTHGAVMQAQQHIKAGYCWVVDIDLAKFFDRVNHDLLMARVARKVKDQRALRLIRRYLQAGVLEGGLTSPTLEGTPQGGPLSPLLSNIMLDDLDKELEKRGHRFCRYADDANVYARSRRAGERLMDSLTSFLSRRLRLQVNHEKSAVDRPSRRQFLGFSFTPRLEAKLRVAPDREKRLKARFRELLRIGRGRTIRDTVKALAPKIRGWVGYYRLCEVKASFERLDEWLRRRIRALHWRQWKRPRNRARQLVRRGLEHELAWRSAWNGRGPWWNAGARHMNQAIPTRTMRTLGLVSFLEEFQRITGSAG
jgi:RNA-directed DNA polymerase